MTHRIDAPIVTRDDARIEFCHRLATAIREGATGVQVRFVHAGETTTAAWFYTQSHHEWKKRDDLALSPNLIVPLQDFMEGLFTQEYTDAWTHHRTDHSDRTDFELKFRREALDLHVTGDLESYLNGCLSHAHHDSGQDVRRRIRFQRR